MGAFGALERGGNGRRPSDDGLGGGRESAAFRAREPSRIGQFIQRMLIGERPEGKPVRLTLSHVGPGGRPDALIGSQQIMELSEEGIAKLAVEIYAYAENDAAGLGRSAQRYVLQSYYETDPGNPSGRIVFQILAGGQASEGAGESIDSDPPTSTGLISQVMRQNERLHAQFAEIMEGVATLVHAQSVQTNQLSEQVNRFMAERVQHMDLLEKARSDQWIREREARRDDMQYRVQSELVGGLKMLVPAVARRLTGAKVPDAPVPEREQLLAIAKSFSEDQLNKVAVEGTLELDPTQRMAFLEWYKQECEISEGKAPSTPSVVPGVTAPVAAAAAPAPAAPAAPAPTEKKE